MLAEIPPVSGTAQIEDRNESESQYSSHCCIVVGGGRLVLVRWPRREEKLQGAGVGKRGTGVGGQHSGGGGCTRTISSAEVFLQCLPDELQSWERALPVHIQYHKYKFSLLCIVKK